MKKFVVVLAMIFAMALLAQPMAQAGVFFRFGLPIPVPVPVFYGPAYYPGGYYYGPYGYAHSLTDTGATIDNGPSGSPIRPLSIEHSKMKIEGQGPFTGQKD